MNKEQIIQEYQNGKSISELSSLQTDFNYREIRKILINNGITIRGGRKKKYLTDEQIAQIKPLYINNTRTLQELAKMVNLDKSTLKLLIEEEYKWERKNNNRVNKRIDSYYFSNIDTAEKAYWLGFLFTDGSVDYSRGLSRVRLQLQQQDKHILEEFKQDLCLDCKLIEDIRTNSVCYSVEFTDEQIVKDLAKYGIVPRKTYITNHIPYELIPEQYLADFARGLFDGDGNLYIQDTDATFGFTSYAESCVQDFKQIINKIVNISSNNTPFFTSAWHINWRGRKQVKKILDILYSNSTRHLNRKFQLYQHLKASLI